VSGNPSEMSAGGLVFPVFNSGFFRQVTPRMLSKLLTKGIAVQKMEFVITNFRRVITVCANDGQLGSDGGDRPRRSIRRVVAGDGNKLC